MKYLKKFENHSAYAAAESGLILPNVSLCVQENEVHYKPIIPETKLVVYYNIQDISSPTTIFTNYDNSVKSIEVDGNLLDSVVTTYQFDTVGEHIIKYEFNNPTMVGNNAPLFYNSTIVKRVKIPNTFTSISSNAFNNCYSLSSVTIPDSVTNIGGSVFYNCSGLTSITIPSSVTSIGGGTFYGCSSLTNIEYNAQYMLDNSLSFNQNTAITTVVIGNLTPSIGEAAFGNCYSLTNLTIGSGVTSIGHYAFDYCSGLTEVTIPNSVTSIGSQAFRGCSGLTSIDIPSGVTSIGSYAFAICLNLTSITVLATTPPTLGNDGVFNRTNDCPIYVPSDSVDAYKSAQYWSELSSRIQAIPTT